MTSRLGRFIPVLSLAACAAEPPHEVELTAEHLSPGEAEAWPLPAVQSGSPVITVRQVFVAQGPCRELEAVVARTYPGEVVLRVSAHVEGEECDDRSRHLGYTAALRGLPEGVHDLRVVHVGADGRTLTETVFQHQIVVTSEPAR